MYNSKLNAEGNSDEMEEVTTELNRYFNNQVQLKTDERNAIFNDTVPIIERLAKYINKKDPRFGTEVIKMGSSFEALMVGEPNGFDVTIPLLGVKQYRWGPYDPRYYDVVKVENQHGTGPSLPPNYHLQRKLSGKFKKVDEVVIFENSVAQPHPDDGFTFTESNSKDSMWLDSDDLIFKEDIIPILVKKHYQDLLIQGIRELNLRKKVKVDKKLHGPAINMKIEGQDVTITINLNLIISRAACFPNYAGWPHLNTTWPSRQKKDIISTIGISLITSKDLWWMVSPALAEQELMKGLDRPGECREKSLLIMKKLNEDLWSKRGPAIASYALENLLFWECESYPESAQWTVDKLLERIMSMTKKLYQCVCKEDLKVYFMPVINLLKKETEAEKSELQKVKEKIEEFLNDPLHIIQQLNTTQ